MTRKKLTVLVAAALSLCLPFAHAQSLGPVIMPGADLMVNIDLEKIQNSPMSSTMKELQQKEKEAMQGTPLAGVDQADQLFATFTEMIGLEKNDMLTLVASAQLDGMNMAGPPDLKNADILVGVKLAKELPIDKLQAGLKMFAAKQAEKNGSAPPVISRLSYAGQPVLGIKDGEGGQPVYVAMAGGSKVILVGSQKGLQGGLDRYKSGTNVSPRTLFPASIGKVVSRSNFYMIIKPTPEMMATMKSQSEGNPNPEAGVMAQMKAAGIGLNFGDTMDLSVIGSFATPQVAQQASMLLDGKLISLVKIFASSMTGGTPLPVLQTMKAGNGDGNTAWLKLSLSKTDLEVLSKAAKEKQQQMMQNNAMPEGDAVPQGDW